MTRSKKATRVANVRHLKAKARYSQLKRYVNFKFEDTDYGARKIREIYKELWPLLHQPHTDYSPRSNSSRKIAANSVGVKNRKSYRAIPVPSNGVEGIKVSVSGGKLRIKSDFVEQSFIIFNKRRLARGGSKYVAGLVAGYSQKSLFKIQTGNYEIAAAHSRATVADEVAKLQLKYSVGNDVAGRGKITRSQSWHNWLNGLIKFESKNQIDAKVYIARREKAKKASYKANKKKRVK